MNHQSRVCTQEWIFPHYFCRKCLIQRHEDSCYSEFADQLKMWGLLNYVGDLRKVRDIIQFLCGETDGLLNLQHLLLQNKSKIEAGTF